MVDYAGLAGRAESAAEKAALEAEQVALSALLNYAELTLADVNAELVRSGAANVTDCRQAYTIVADAQAVLDRSPEVSLRLADPPTEVTLIQTINGSFRQLRSALSPSPANSFDTRPIAALPWPTAAI